MCSQFGFSLAVLRLGYELRLRIRERIVAINEKTITFANIQQISIRQGPLQQVEEHRHAAEGLQRPPHRAAPRRLHPSQQQ